MEPRGVILIWHRCPNSSEDNIPVGKLRAPIERKDRMSVDTTDKSRKTEENRRGQYSKSTFLSKTYRTMSETSFWGSGTQMLRWFNPLNVNYSLFITQAMLPNTTFFISLHEVTYYQVTRGFKLQ